MPTTPDTIVAVATAPGRGGIGVVRVSGVAAYPIAQAVCQAQQFTPRLASYRTFYTADKEQLDQGLILYFQAPHSFTGEDVIEFHGHGAPIVLDQLVATCIQHGARLARPGEFSERAFLNDKIDLAQAEAIADLIQANNITAARSALRSLQGEFSQQINLINKQLIHLRLYVEAAIDFPEEEIDFLSDGTIQTQIEQITQALTKLKANAVQGVMVREGLNVVIAGRPNAGKSTLINCLAGRDVAIVTNVAGTTRDVMREYITLDELSIHLIDTAGLRESTDVVEQEGIKRAWDEVKRADCVLLVVDATEAKADHIELNQTITNILPEQVPIIRVMNKIDQCTKLPQISNEDEVYIAAKSGQGIELLIQKIKQVAGFQPHEGQFIARRRHVDALNKANQLVAAGYTQLQHHRAGELLAEDLRLAHSALCEITGEFSADDLLGEIFSSFCIGK